MKINGNYHHAVFLCFLSCSYRNNFPSFNCKKNIYFKRCQNFFMCENFLSYEINLRVEKVTVIHSSSLTFYKQFCEALLVPYYTFICCIISQRAVVYGQYSLIPNRLKNISEKRN